MPKVPDGPAMTMPMQRPQVDPSLVLMAAASMHEQGRLFEPTDIRPDVQKLEMPDTVGGGSADVHTYKFEDKSTTTVKRGQRDLILKGKGGIY